MERRCRECPKSGKTNEFGKSWASFKAWRESIWHSNWGSLQHKLAKSSYYKRDHQGKIFERKIVDAQVPVLFQTKNFSWKTRGPSSMGAPILDNVCDLSVHCIRLNDDFVPAVVSFLRGMPNLNILCIRRAGTWIDAETSEVCCLLISLSRAHILCW